MPGASQVTETTSLEESPGHHPQDVADLEDPGETCHLNKMTEEAVDPSISRESMHPSASPYLVRVRQSH